MYIRATSLTGYQELRQRIDGSWNAFWVSRPIHRAAYEIEREKIRHPQ